MFNLITINHPDMFSLITINHPDMFGFIIIVVDVVKKIERIKYLITFHFSNKFSLISNHSVYWISIIQIEKVVTKSYDIYLNDKTMHNIKNQSARFYNVITFGK